MTAEGKGDTEEEAGRSANRDSPEIVVGVVAPVGTEKDKLKRVLTAVVPEYDYIVRYHKLSEFFRTSQVQEFVGRQSEDSNEYERILSAMDIGDRFRWASQQKEALGLVAAATIASRRGPDRRLALRRTLHIRIARARCARSDRATVASPLRPERGGRAKRRGLRPAAREPCEGSLLEKCNGHDQPHHWGRRSRCDAKHDHDSEEVAS